MGFVRRGVSHGFTLVELLVVIAIIGVLIALLLPGIQGAREAARRMTCSNNMKQLALGLHSFHDSQNELPRGLYSAPRKDDRYDEDGLGWATKILPFIEQKSAYDQIAAAQYSGIPSPWTPGIFDAAYKAGEKIPGGIQAIPTFRCPSSPLDSHVPEQEYGGKLWDMPFSGYATSDYKGSRGFCDRGLFWRTAEGLLVDTCYRSVDGALVEVPKQPYRQVRFNSIPDGLSHTIALGEAAYYEHLSEWPFWLGAAQEDETTLFKTESPINCWKPGAPKRLPAETLTDDCAFSWHTGGAQFAFADGSVHFLREDIDVLIYGYLGDRMDGEVIIGLELD